jgi:hypothetical protein
MMKPILTTLVLMALAGSCQYGVSDIPSVPDNPTYNRDIFPLYADHCLVCHASPPNRGAPGYFRLDAYDDDIENKVAGAGSYAPMCLDEIENKKMPPAAKQGEGVGPKGLEMLRRWVANGAPE